MDARGIGTEPGPEIETDGLRSIVHPADQARQTFRERRAARRAQVVVPPAELEATAPALPGAPQPSVVRSLASVDRGLQPLPGAQAPAFFWADLPDGEPPPRRTRGEGAYVVYHALEVDADLRITYQTAVSVRVPADAADSGQAQLIVDARTSVQKRALLELMDRVRRGADQAARRRRETLARRLARHRWEVLRWPHWATPLGFTVVRAEARVGGALLTTRRRVTRSLVEVPDAFISRALRVDAHLSTHIGRASLWDGIKHPQGLSAEQRSVVLFLTLATLGLGILVANSVFALGASGYADTWRDALQLFLLQIASLFGVPLPIEVPFMAALLFNDRLSAGGIALALGSVMAGKMVGAWILYLLGDGLLDHVRKHTKSARAKRMVDWLTRNADKHGFGILVADNAIPFMPDQLMLVLAVAGMRFRAWMWGIGIGTLIKFTGIIAAVYFIGPDRVTGFFEHPFG